MGPTDPELGSPNEGSGEPAECFVIQPFGRKEHPDTGVMVDNDAVYEALRALSTLRPSFPIHVYRANVVQYTAGELHPHVIKCIKESDFCLADFTGHNVNVLYEAGFARGLGREVIQLCQDKSDIPTDLLGFITVRYDPSQLHHLADDIDQHLDRIRSAVEAKRKQAWSSVHYFQTREEADIHSHILKATATIDILQTNLATIQVSYLPALLHRMRENPTLRLRILTLNPQSIFVNYRGQQLGFGENIALFRGECEAHLEGVHYPLREFGDRAQIRLYDDFPTQIAFSFDDEILVCVVSVTGRSRGNCAFLVNANMPGAAPSFSDHFEKLWNELSVPYGSIAT